MLKIRPFLITLMALSPAAMAQQPPNAGRQMQQIPPVPLPQKFEPGVDVVPRSQPESVESAGVRILVKSLAVTGAKVYPEAELLALTGFVPGSELSLADLRGMALKIGNHYRSNGYFVAQAYLPAQDIKNGAVTIAVIEGAYGKITLNNQTRLSDGLARNHLDGLNSGDPITAAPLEHRLLLLSDIPGIRVKSTLAPGATVGASDLNIELTPAPLVSGEVDLDNAGNRYTGVYRLGGTVNVNNLAGNGDVFSLRGITTGSGLNYARASYQMMFGKATAGIAYSALRYELGKEYKALDANGTAEIASVYGSYPLIRSRNHNLNLGLIYEHKTFEDRIDSVNPDLVTEKNADVLSASLYGNQRDRLFGGGFTSYGLTWSTGNLDIETDAARFIDAATARTNGHYNKLSFNAYRLQQLIDSVSLSANINGQFASTNLDSSEKMGLGGMYGVRAYPEGEGYGDEGYVLNLEVRYLLPKFSATLPGQMHLIGFVDTGGIRINKDPWAPGDNTRQLSGAGAGIHWAHHNNFLARAYYAAKLGNEDAISAPDRSGRFWFQVVKYF